MKESLIHVIAFIFLVFSLVCTILYYFLTEQGFVVELSFMSIALSFAFITIILLTVLFVKHKKGWSQLEYINTIIEYTVATFIVILTAILLHRVVILEQAIWYTLPTMLLYESGKNVYQNSDILINNIQPLESTFQQYQNNLFNEENVNLDMMTRIVLLSFVNTNSITIELPDTLFDTYFYIQIISLDGNSIASFSNDSGSTIKLNSPNSKSSNGISVSSVIAYLYLVVHMNNFSEDNYNKIQTISESIHFKVQNPSLRESVIANVYPNISEKSNFHIRNPDNFPTLEYFQLFSKIKPLQTNNISPFWNNFETIGIHNGYYDSKFFYLLSPLLKNVQHTIQKRTIEKRKQKNWFSPLETKLKNNNLFTNQVRKTILYWFFKYPIPEKNFIFFTLTDNDGLYLDGTNNSYSFSIDTSQIEFLSKGFWSLSVYNTETKKLSSLESHYSSSVSEEVILGTDVTTANVLVPRKQFYVILKFVNVRTKSIPKNAYTTIIKI